MAEGAGSNELDINHPKPRKNGDVHPKPPKEDEEDEDEDEEEEEPRLKYATLTKNLNSIYRNGDASSTFLVAGDKMIVATHNGSTHVLSVPFLQSLRFYRAHTASITAISISPFPPPLPTGRPENVNRIVYETQDAKGRSPSIYSVSSAAKQKPKQPPVPATPSNSIYIATSSIDGHVCISSLVDERDVQLRNFGRPVQAVALSPDYKNDRNYLSGGQAGSLILTTGGQAGKSTNATTTGAAAAASGWLGSIGLGTDMGQDKVLHSGEGTIGTIKWSLSGKYVLWVNEQGIKIMRSNLHLESVDSAFQWKRISHIDRPNRTGWEEMAGVWKARAEWINRDSLETEEDSALESSNAGESSDKPSDAPQQADKKTRPEEVVVGWGDTVWLIKIYPGNESSGKDTGERTVGRAEVATILRTDCIISGISLYTQTLLLVLAHTESEEQTATKKGRRRQNALEPELRLIDINTKEEVSADTLTVSRYQSLSASDYHLGVLPPAKMPVIIQRGTLGAIGSATFSGLETVGQGVWDATMYPTRMFSSSRMFSSGASIRSGRESEEKGSIAKGSLAQSGRFPGPTYQPKDLQDVATTQGMKIFIYSPYDCIVAVKRDLTDRLQWLAKMARYRQAWELLDKHPEAVIPEPSGSSPPSTLSKMSSPVSGPSEQQKPSNSLADFFADTSSISSSSTAKKFDSAAEKEKRRIGDLWLQQLISAGDWTTAGDIASKVLGTSSQWEHWAWVFVRNKKFDEISHVLPTLELTPPLPSPIYEIILGHYVVHDRPRFKELLELWPSDLFDLSSITTAIEDQLESGTVSRNSNDWHILQEGLAKLYLADGRHKEALRCYIQLQDADTALAMIKDQHLLDAVADDIRGLILLRISPEQLRKASVSELEELSSEPVKLLVGEATHGVVPPEMVVTQLEDSSLHPFLYFYLRALWRGEGTSATNTPKAAAPKVGHKAAAHDLAVDEGKVLVEQFADTAVSIFADFDRPLLMEFLHTSTAYHFAVAVSVCETRHFVPELVYLLSKTGQTKKALFLIIDELDDVVQAISFAKEQDDPDLWEDLLEYSMSRPKFIEGLLTEVGTTIDPIALVRRIPSGLEIEGLRYGLQKIIREYDLQDSISVGVAKVLQGEVAVGMETLRKGRRRGIKFDVRAGTKKTKSKGHGVTSPKPTDSDGVANGHVIPTAVKSPLIKEVQPGHCAGCDEAFHIDDETLVGFACGHIYHLSHLLHDPVNSSQPPSPSAAVAKNADELDAFPAQLTRTVGPKVTKARLLREKIEAVGGCRICKVRRERNEEVQ